ncbi:MAG TPA: glycosyltransferase 87 family protein [Myxococcota bacterium]|nr:glycosyltransferase 87 family protein [Myxococcota bacterium]
MPLAGTGPDRRRVILLASAVVLFSLSAAYLGWGFRQLLVGPPPVAAIDLRYRWMEERYFARRQNPLDQVRLALGRVEEGSAAVTVDPEIGPMPPKAVGYPPWSLVTGLALAPPIAFPATRIWMALLDVAALAAIARLAWRELRDLGREEALVGVAASLALVSNLFTVSAGQYGLVVNALVLAALGLAGRGRGIVAGLCLALALVKPQSAGLFALLFLVRGWLVPLLTAGVVLVAEAALALAWIRASPLRFANDLYALASGLWGEGYGPLALLLGHGGDPGRLVPLLGAAGLGLALGLVVAWRRATLLVQLAIAAVIGRLWTYHHTYDNVMLVFLLLALLRAALEQPSRPLVVGALGAVAATLVAPVSWRLHHALPVLQAAHVLAWIGGLAVLLAATPRSPRTRAAPSLRRDGEDGGVARAEDGWAEP